MSSKSECWSAHGFKHVCRSLKEGESLPRLPSLLEQVMACRFELPSAGDEIAEEHEYSDDEFVDDDFVDEDVAVLA